MPSKHGQVNLVAHTQLSNDSSVEGMTNYGASLVIDEDLPPLRYSPSSQTSLSRPSDIDGGSEVDHRRTGSNSLLQAAHLVKDMAIKPKPQDHLDQPLLSSSMHSLKDVHLTQEEPPPRQLNQKHHDSRSSHFSVGPRELNPSSLPPSNYSNSLGQAYTPTQPSKDGCYSQNEVIASNGDLSEGNRVYRRSDRPRYASKPRTSVSTMSRSSSIRGSTITFRQISYEVDVKRWPWSKATKKIVLDNVSGIMYPGLNAIMGPTGSGKSSLLDVLAARKDPRFLKGEVLIDGATQPPNFKCISGYVVQDDIVMGTLTVRENLRFSAALRLPKSRTDEERKAKVEDVIEELALTKVADSKIGTELIRGVSGGERKRTNIGMELITDPPVLFLDEPTTGLDAFTANSVIKTLRRLANRGRTIVFSIHQPKYSIYKLFETLTLVVSGKIAYHGRADDEPLSYFQKIGYLCEAHNNPADFFMDIIHGEVSSRQASSASLDQMNKLKSDMHHPVNLAATRKISFVNHSAGHLRETLEYVSSDGVDEGGQVEELDTERQATQKEKVSQKLIDQWARSAQATHVDEEVESIYQDSLVSTSRHVDDVKIKRGEKIDYPTSYWNQFIWVSWRTALNLIRNPQSSVIQLAVYLFFAISIGTVYVNLDDSTETGIQNRQGLFFFLLLQMVFVNLGAIEIFIKERVIFVHENSSGFYRVSVYFLAKVCCDMLPIKTLPVVIFMPIVYFMARLKLTVAAFFFYELTLVLATCAACGVAFFVSASVSIFGIANIIISIMYVFMMVFGGYLKSLSSIGPVLNWCRYLSVFNYAFSALSINEFKGSTFCPRFNTTNVTRCEQGDIILINQSIAYDNDWYIWGNQLGLLAITVFFCILCYVQLRRINKYK